MRELVLSFILTYNLNFIYCQTDTINKHRLSSKSSQIFKPTISGTYITQHNWDGNNQNLNTIAILVNADYNHRIATQKFVQYYQFRSALGLFKIVDSIWIKNNDYWRASATVTDNTSKKITHTYSIQAYSQFINTKKYVYDVATDSYIKKRTATFFNPGTVLLSYGLNWSFWDGSFINFNFASIKYSTKPRFTGYVDPNNNQISKSKNAYQYFDYGMNINISIIKEFNENVAWENNTVYFMNGINRNGMHLDFMNRLCFKFLKYMQFRVNTHLIYEPLYSWHLQSQYDFTLGVFYEFKKRKG